MSEAQLAPAEIERLERIVQGDPTAPAFPALAEAHRRAGDPKRAEQVARAGLAGRPDHVAGGVALGLALIDQGRQAEARAVLVRALEATPEHLLARRALEDLAGTSPELPALDTLDSELDAALELARADSEAMIDADDLAQEAVRRVDPIPDEATELVTAEGSPFATRTVAHLLEQQGDADAAQVLRRNLEQRRERSSAERKRRLVTRLEGWLVKLRRGEPR